MFRSASALGLWLTLSCAADALEAAPRAFVLMGHLAGDWEARWDPAVPRLSLSAYIHDLLIAQGAGDCC